MEREKLFHDINVRLSHRRVSGTCVLVCLTCVPHAHWVTQLWEPSQKVGRGTYLWVPLTDIDQRNQHYYLEDGAFRECMLLCPITEIASESFTTKNGSFLREFSLTFLIDDTTMSEHLWMHPLQGIRYSWYSLASEDTRTRSLPCFLIIFQSSWFDTPLTRQCINLNTCPLKLVQ